MQTLVWASQRCIGRLDFQHSGNVFCRWLNHRQAIAEIVGAVHAVEFFGEGDDVFARSEFLAVHDAEQGAQTAAFQLGAAGDLDVLLSHVLLDAQPPFPHLKLVPSNGDGGQMPVRESARPSPPPWGRSLEGELCAAPNTRNPPPNIRSPLLHQPTLMRKTACVNPRGLTLLTAFPASLGTPTLWFGRISEVSFVGGRRFAAGPTVALKCSHFCFQYFDPV